MDVYEFFWGENFLKSNENAHLRQIQYIFQYIESEMANFCLIVRLTSQTKVKHCGFAGHN